MEGTRDNFLFKTDYDYFEFVIAWKNFERVCIPALQKLLFERYPVIKECDDDFKRHLHVLCEHNCYETFERFWRIIVHNRQGKSPYDFPLLEFPVIKEEPKENVAPDVETADDYKEQHFFIRMTKEEQDEFIIETNRENYLRWEYMEGYTRSFINAMQEILLVQVPELIDLESDWWIVYEYRFRQQFWDFKDRAERIEHVIKSGLTGNWLDKDFRELDKKLAELHDQEWHKKYGTNKD